MSEQFKTTDRDEYFKAYQEHAKTLKTWFVAYGVGVLILLITKDRPWDAIIKSGYAMRVAGLSVAGVSAQVLISLMNKVSNWFCYYGEFRPDFKLKSPYKVARWFEGQFWVDCLVDLFTLAAFVWSTWYLFRAFGT
jgi:hypothetical protein